MGILAGKTLGPYVVAERLGVGGMGEVYRATDTRLDRQVAIKILPDELSDNPKSLERFRREAKAVSSLNHPHICTLHDVGEEDGLQYLVMELVEGDTLDRRLATGGLSFEQAIDYSCQIAAALDEAHRAGVVHRDLKPGNIMVTRTGVKVLDFGLAKFEGDGAEGSSSLGQTLLTQGAATRVHADELNPSEPLTAEGTIMGTLHYMAPEQLEGRRVDARADIFALGVVIYEMITGQRAFDGDSQASLIAAILKDDPPPMGELQAMTPPLLDHVVRRCLAKSPDDRWQSAGDVMRELKWAVQAGPAASGAAGVVEPPARTSRIPLLLSGLAGVLVTATAAWFFLDREPAIPADGITRFEIELPEGVHLGAEPEDHVITRGRPSLTAFALSPDGRKLAYVGRAEEDWQIYLHSFERNESRPIPGTQGGTGPFFSPDGRALGFFVGPDLKRIPVEGGEARTIDATDATFYSGSGASWTGEETILLGSRTGILQVPANGGTPVPLTTDEDSRCSFRFPQLLPAGNAFLFAMDCEAERPSDSDIVVESLESHERTVVVERGTHPQYTDSGHIVFAREGTLMAVPFDLDRLQATADPVVVLDDLMQAEDAANSQFDTGTAQFAVSRAGLLVHVGGGVFPAHLQTLEFVDLEGQATPIPLPPDRYSFPRFSPDGASLAYLRSRSSYERSIWVLDLERGLSTPIRSSNAIGDLAWSPDGGDIIYTGKTAGGTGDLYRVAADGSSEPRQLTASEGYPLALSWARTGVLAIRQYPNIMTWSLESETEPAVFVEGESYLAWPAFSHDGKWLAYSSEETGRSEIYVRPYPKGTPAYRVSDSGGTTAIWAPDDRKIYYRRPHEMRVVDVTSTDHRFRTSRSRLLFEGNYIHSVPMIADDLSPEGDRFAMGSGEEWEPETVTRVEVTLNWFEELDRLAPAP